MIRLEGKLWRVRFTTPPSPNYKYWKNRNALVVADDLPTAAAMVIAEYPGCRIDGMNHEGGDVVIAGPLP